MKIDWEWVVLILIIGCSLTLGAFCAGLGLAYIADQLVVIAKNTDYATVSVFWGTLAVLLGTVAVLNALASLGMFLATIIVIVREVWLSVGNRG